VSEEALSGETEGGDVFHDAIESLESDDSEQIDWEDDPLEAREKTEEPSEWDHAFIAKFIPQKPCPPDDGRLRKELRELLSEMEAGLPEGDRDELEEKLTKWLQWLQPVEDNVHPVAEFVAGSFGRHVAAWKELLGESSRPASRSVLTWIRNGVKPSFIGTAECDPKKLDRVKRMLRRVVGENRVEEWLSGQVPHPVEFSNHRSFTENSEFGILAVGKMLTNTTVKLYGEGERKPKVVNPLGVANLPKGRLVLDAGYINSFTKHIPFKYETL
jgi:hypothetical protein